MKKYKEFKTTEHGIQLRNITNMSFPGNEWWEDSGTVCEIWYKGKYFADFINRADGGDVDIKYIEKPNKELITAFLNDVKKDIPSEYYDNIEKYYKSLGKYIWDQYEDILNEDRNRKEGKPSDILALIDIGEKLCLNNKKRGK